MKKVIKYTPPNSIVFITDTDGGVVPSPENWTNELVHASSTCVCVVCYPEIDGETELMLGSVDEVTTALGLDLVFDGLIATPTKEVMVSDVYVKRLLQTRVPDLQTRIRVWVDHPRWPKKVIVGWG